MSQLWTVEGADKRTGKEIKLHIEAITREEAEQKAFAKGVMVSSVRPSRMHARAAAEAGTGVMNRTANQPASPAKISPRPAPRRSLTPILIGGGCAMIGIIVAVVIVVVGRQPQNQPAPSAVPTPTTPQPEPNSAISQSDTPLAVPISGSMLTYADFLAKMNSVAIVKGHLSDGYHTVVTKEMLLATFGEPLRVQQPGSDEVDIFYSIKDGTAQIQGVASFWNGADQFKYLDSQAPPYPLRAQLDSISPKSSAGVPDRDSPEYKQAILKWWKGKGHADKWEVKLDQYGRNYFATRNGKYYYFEDTKKADIEKDIQDLTVGEAEQELQSEADKYRGQYEADHMKTVEEPCLLVMQVTVF